MTFAQVIVPHWMPVDMGTIRGEFMGLLLSLGLPIPTGYGFTIRTPAENYEMANRSEEECAMRFQGQDPNQWHIDAQNVTGFNPYAMVLWSNHGVTEVRSIESGEVLKASDGAIVLVRNLLSEHRTPPETKGYRDRWMARAIYDFAGELGGRYGD